MRAFYVLVVCIFATTVIYPCESKEYQARVADRQNMHPWPRHHSAQKTVEENKVKVSAVSLEAELPGSNVNPEEIVQQAKDAAERAKVYPKTLEEWEQKIKKKMAAQKAGEKTTKQAEVASPKAHSLDRQEMKVHTASVPSMTMDDWVKRFNDGRKSFMDRIKSNQQKVKIAALPVKVYNELRKNLVQEQEIDEGVKIASPNYKTMPYPHPRPWVEEEMKHKIKQQAKMTPPLSYPHYPSTVKTGEEVKEAVLQREREKIWQRYNVAKQNAMKLNRDDVKEIMLHQESNNHYPMSK